MLGSLGSPHNAMHSPSYASTDLVTLSFACTLKEYHVGMLASRPL